MLKIITNKILFIMFLITCIFLFSCEENYTYKEEKFKLKQLTNSSTTTLHSHFLSSSSSTDEQIIKFAYYNKEGGIKIFSTHILNCQIFEDVDKIEDSYLKIKYKSFNYFKRTIEDMMLHCYGAERSEGYITFNFHVPKNSIENFILIDVKK